MLAIVKLVVGVCLLALIGFLVDWSAVAAVLRRADVAWIAGAFLVSVLGVLISAEKWNGLLRDNRIRLRLRRAAELYWVGMFFSNFLPTSVGGDAIRLVLTPAHGRTERVAGTILIERLTGLFVMLAFSAIGLLVGPLSSGHPGLIVALLSAVLGLLGIVTAALVAPMVLAKLLPVMVGRLPGFLQRALRKLHRVVITVARQTWRRQALLRALLLSVPFLLHDLPCPILRPASRWVASKLERRYPGRQYRAAVELGPDLAERPGRSRRGVRRRVWCPGRRAGCCSGRGPAAPPRGPDELRPGWPDLAAELQAGAARTALGQTSSSLTLLGIRGRQADAASLYRLKSEIDDYVALCRASPEIAPARPVRRWQRCASGCRPAPAAAGPRRRTSPSGSRRRSPRR